MSDHDYPCRQQMALLMFTFLFFTHFIFLIQCNVYVVHVLIIRSLLLFSFRHDRTMQDIVYKLVPGLQEGRTHTHTHTRTRTHTLHCAKSPLTLVQRDLLCLCLCSGDEEAERLLSEVGDGGSWGHQRRTVHHENPPRPTEWYGPTH